MAKTAHAPQRGPRQRRNPQGPPTPAPAPVPAARQTRAQANRTTTSTAQLTTTSSSSNVRKITKAERDIRQAGARRVPARPPSYWGLRSNEEIPRIPPRFQDSLLAKKHSESLPQETLKYYLRIRRRDDGILPLGKQSPVFEILQNDAEAAENGGRRLWKRDREKEPKGVDHIQVWKIEPVDRSPPLRVVIKAEPLPRFYFDYLREAEYTRRLNLAGCNEIITVIDWAVKDNNSSRICYEWAPHATLSDLVGQFYEVHHLILPESFIWHALKCIASGLAYCHDGTNTGHRVAGWDPLVHTDLKDENIFLFEEHREENKLYSYVKIADLGSTFAAPDMDAKRFHAQLSPHHGTKGYIPPEGNAKQEWHHDRRGECPESGIPGEEADIWTMGLVIRRMIMLINVYVPEKLQKSLMERKIKRPFYSPALNRLVEWCMSKDPDKRPTASQVYNIACFFHGKHRAKLYAREQYARSQNQRAFLGQVLFPSEDFKQYNEDVDFARNYREANVGPLRDWLGIKRSSWRDLEPGSGPFPMPTGPSSPDLRVSPLEKRHSDPSENAHLILQQNMKNRWIRDYYEAAGALVVRPRKKPDMSTPADPGVARVMNASWDSAPAPRKDSLEHPEMYYSHHRDVAPAWGAKDFEREENWYGAEDHYNGGSGTGGPGQGDLAGELFW